MNLNFNNWACRLILILAVVSATNLCLKAQDPIFSQFYNAPLQLNPAFAGISDAPRFALNYRNQWPLFKDNFQTYSTYSLSYDQYFSKYSSGIGIVVLGDDAGGGFVKSTRAGFIYSYNLKLYSGLFLKSGIEVGLIQTNYDWDRFIFGDQLDEVSGPVGPGGTVFPSDETEPEKTNSTNLDLSFGSMVYTPDYYAGFTLKHINTPDISILGINDNLFEGLPLRWSLHAGAQFLLNNNSGIRTFLSPNALFVKQGDYIQINAGSYISFGSFFTGLWYRHANTNPDALILTAGLKKGMLKIGYSFDYTISKFGIANGGSHELGIVIDLGFNKKKKRDFNDCFQLFR